MIGTLRSSIPRPCDFLDQRVRLFNRLFDFEVDIVAPRMEEMTAHGLCGSILLAVGNGMIDFLVGGDDIRIPVPIASIRGSVLDTAFFEPSEDGEIDGISRSFGNREMKCDVCFAELLTISLEFGHGVQVFVYIREIAFAGILRREASTLRFDKNAKVDELEKGVVLAQDRIGFESGGQCPEIRIGDVGA